jgi:hypothetical protein
VTDQKKQRKDKPAHKENEAIEFEFNIGVDDCSEIAFNMYKASVARGLYSLQNAGISEKNLLKGGGCLGKKVGYVSN